MNPTPVPTCPARVRPWPRWTVTASSACPGRTNTGAAHRPALDPQFDLVGVEAAHAVRRAAARCIAMPSRCAVAGPMKAALPQVSLVTGLGNSWSQPLLANRPSYRVGSGRKQISNPAASLGERPRCRRTSRPSGRPFARQPPCRRSPRPAGRAPRAARSRPGCPARAASARARSPAPAAHRCSTMAARSSMAEWPPCSGSISGCWIVTVPS